MISKSRMMMFFGAIFLCVPLQAEIVCINFQSIVTVDFSNGPCAGLSDVGQIVTGRICYDDSVLDSDPVVGEGRFVDAISSFEFNVGSVMGSVDASQFMINTTDSDSTSGPEGLLISLLNTSSMQVPASMNIDLTGLFFDLTNTGSPVFSDPDSLAGIAGIFDQFDQATSRFSAIGSCTDPSDPGSSGIFGFDAQIQQVSLVPEPGSLTMFVAGLSIFFLRLRNRQS
ncbi:MAG: PEP-CTERM sorting domain-containing protein [Planctomycetota bacterium]